MSQTRNLHPVEENAAEEEALDDTSPVPAPLEEGADFLEETGFEEADSTRSGAWGWLVPTLAILTILGWTGFFGWVHQAEILAGATPAQWSAWITEWCIPVLLVIGLWLLAMRNSRREASRFAFTARMLSDESAQLETRLSVVNRELSLARDFIASQSRDLESLGRVATERLSTNAERLQALIHDNSAQVETIGSVSETALANMESLRDQLPVLTSAARDMNNQIGNAGNVAQGQVEALVEAFDRLNQFGEVSESHVKRVEELVSQTLDAFDRQVAALGEVTQARFRKLREVSEAFRSDLVDSEETAFAAIERRSQELSLALATQSNAQHELEQDAVDSMRNRITALTDETERLLSTMGDGREQAATAWSEAITALQTRMTDAIGHITQVDERAMENARQRLDALAEEARRVDERVAASISAFDEDMQRRRAELAEREAAEIAGLESRIADLDERVSARQKEHVAHIDRLSDHGEALAARLSSLTTEMQELAERGEETRSGLGEAAQLLTERLSQSRAMLDESKSFLSDLTDDSVRLLEIIRSSVDHTEGELSTAVGNAESSLSSFGEEANRLQTLFEEVATRGATLAEHVEAARTGGAASLEHLQDMEAKIASLAEESEQLAERTGSELRDTIEKLASSSVAALEDLRTNQREAVEEIAGSIAQASRDRVAEAIREDAASVIGELEAAVVRAAENGRDTAVKLRDQLKLLNDLTGNLEQRISYARDRAEEQVDSDFTRRMALIMESLNSSAIDIAKAFENEVSDTQWAHYLRGDRGIFTRRAVRLLDKQEARAVTEIYGEDSEFRETVNRFIHDFEAMLREVLSTRDGNAMAVTLLSSDTGKLYVALAQAIERLRD